MRNISLSTDVTKEVGKRKAEEMDESTAEKERVVKQTRQFPTERHQYTSIANIVFLYPKSD